MCVCVSRLEVWIQIFERTFVGFNWVYATPSGSNNLIAQEPKNPDRSISDQVALSRCLSRNGTGLGQNPTHRSQPEFVEGHAIILVSVGSAAGTRYRAELLAGALPLPILSNSFHTAQTRKAVDPRTRYKRGLEWSVHRGSRTWPWRCTEVRLSRALSLLTLARAEEER